MTIILPTTDRVARPAQAGYDARLDELLLRFATTPETPLEIQTALPQAPRIQLGSADVVPEEAIVTTIGDISGGEGLFFAHRLHSEQDRLRFWQSRGIDTSAPEGGQAEGFKLLHAVEQPWADTTATPYMAILEDGDAFVADGNRITKLDDVLGTATPSTENPGLDDRTVTGVVRIGKTVFASVGAGTAAPAVARRDYGAGTWSDLASAPQGVQRLWAAKDRLIALEGQMVRELSPTTGAPTTLFTLPEDRVATAVADAGTAILIADDTGRVRSFAPDAGGALEETASVRVGLSEAEYPTCIGAGFGKVLIGTGERTREGGRIGRLWEAEIGSSDSGFALTGLRLVRTFPTDNLAENHAPTAIGWKKASAYVAVPALGETVLWRFQVATSGLSLDLVIPEDQDQVYDVITVNDRLVVSVATEGVYREATTYVASGYIISALAEFGFSSAKAWAWAILNASIPSGASVDVFVSGDEAALDDPAHGTWQRVISAFAGTTLDTLSPIFDFDDPGLAIMVQLTSGTAALTTPRVESASGIGYPLTDELVVTMPVNVSDRVERANRHSFTVRGFGGYLFRDLLARRGQPVELELYREQILLRGVLEAVGSATPGKGLRSSALLVSQVRVRGRITTLGAGGTLGDTTLGIGSLGIDLLGV